VAQVDKIYVINLKDRPEKKDRISKLILSEGLAIPVEFVEAFDLRYIDNKLVNYWLLDQGFKLYPNWRLQNPNTNFEGFDCSEWDRRDITRGEIGCFLSHYYLWKEISSSGQTCLILEDDAFWEPGKLKEFLQSTLPDPELELDFDILYLGRNKISKLNEEFVGQKETFINPKFSFNAHAYILTSFAASKILDKKPEKNIIPADEFLPACWTKHRRQDIYELFRPCLKALAVNKDILDVWQQGFEKYESDTTGLNESKLFDFDLHCFTVADNPHNEGLEINICSASNHKVDIKILGLEEKWEGGDMVNDPGGGQKINLLIPEIEKLKDDDKSIVLFVDGFDILFTGNKEAILERFLSSGKRIIFGAEKSCWPDRSLSEEYPDSPNDYKFLNSGNFIGYAQDLWKILESARKDKIDNIFDDQLYYTKQFLYGDYKHLISLDYNCEIFQCLAFAYEDIKYENKQIYNNITKTKPLIAHGNAGKEDFWRLSNYIRSSWTSKFEFFPVGQNKHNPKIFISVYYTDNYSERWEDFTRRLLEIHYPKDLIHLHIQASTDKLDLIKSTFPIGQYIDVTFNDVNELPEIETKNEAIQVFLSTNCEYFFYIDAAISITRPSILKDLLSLNKKMTAPLLAEFKKEEGRLAKILYKANFWGATDSNGWYARSYDYFKIIERKIKGCFVSPYVNYCYLCKRICFEQTEKPYLTEFTMDVAESDMVFCRNLTYARILFHLDNRFDYGYFVI